MTHNTSNPMSQRGAVAGAIGVAALCVSAAAGQPWASQPHPARISLISEHDAFVPGRTAMLGLRFEMDAQWHVYWDGLNDTGFAPVWELKLPEGWTAGEAQWPAPRRYILPGDILDHIYEDVVTIILPVEVPEGASGEASVGIESQWLVCKEACIPGEGNATLTLPIRASAGPTEQAGDFDATRERLALATTDRTLTLYAGPDRFTVAAPDAAALAFFPARDGAEPVNAIRDGAAEGAELTITLEPGQGPVRGILEISEHDGSTVFVRVDEPREPQGG